MTNPQNPPAAEKMFRELLPLVQTALNAIDKEFGEILINDVFNRVYGREGKLDIKTRELCTVSMLSALGRPDDLKTHFGVALNLGWGLEELQECLLLCCIYAGQEAAIVGLNIYRECTENP